MQQMLEPISGLIDDPELFVKAADEIDDNIGSFPEWMGGEECCELGLCTTNCILEWTWRAMEREEMAAQQFLERIFKLDNDASYVRLNIGAALDFFAGLPENVSSKIYSDLSQEKYAAKRNDLPSIWHLIHHRYEQRFDPAAYLRSCEKHMESDWRYGESLIAAAISRGDFAQAESFVERTFVSLLGAKEIWRQEDRLLETAPQYYSGALETGAVPKLPADLGDGRRATRRPSPGGCLPVAALRESVGHRLAGDAGCLLRVRIPRRYSRDRRKALRRMA
jgi:hypothetical protein